MLANKPHRPSNAPDAVSMPQTAVSAIVPLMPDITSQKHVWLKVNMNELSVFESTAETSSGWPMTETGEGTSTGAVVGARVGISVGLGDGIGVDGTIGATVGVVEGETVGVFVGGTVGAGVGDLVGLGDGAGVGGIGATVGLLEGEMVGVLVGDTVGEGVGDLVGGRVGVGVGAVVGAGVGLGVWQEQRGGAASEVMTFQATQEPDNRLQWHILGRMAVPEGSSAVV